MLLHSDLVRKYRQLVFFEQATLNCARYTVNVAVSRHWNRRGNLRGEIKSSDKVQWSKNEELPALLDCMMGLIAWQSACGGDSILAYSFQRWSGGANRCCWNGAQWGYVKSENITFISSSYFLWPIPSTYMCIRASRIIKSMLSCNYYGLTQRMSVL